MAVAALNASTPSLEAAMSMATEGHGGHAELTHNQTVNALMAITAGLVSAPAALHYYNRTKPYHCLLRMRPHRCSLPCCLNICKC